MHFLPSRCSDLTPTEAPRQIWITRHGESLDNVNGKIGGDSDLSAKGDAYAKALTSFIQYERRAWDVRQEEKTRSTHCRRIPDTPMASLGMPFNTDLGIR